LPVQVAGQVQHVGCRNTFVQRHVLGDGLHHGGLTRTRGKIAQGHT
jgi:hypothetical protein